MMDMKKIGKRKGVLIILGGLFLCLAILLGYTFKWGNMAPAPEYMDQVPVMVSYNGQMGMD